MLRQSQSQKLLQKLSPQQIQLMKLLQIPTVNLEERIKEEMEENPALEYDEGAEEKDEFADDADGEDGDEAAEETSDTVDLEEFMNGGDDDAGGDYGGGAEDYGGKEVQGSFIRVETDFHDHALSQLGMLELDERRTAIAEQIIGSLDDDGYLRREVTAVVDDLLFSRTIDTTVEEVTEIIQRIQQTFDPPGIAAVTLQECLLLQLRRAPQTPDVKAAQDILSRYFSEFTRKHYERIQRGLGLSEAAFKDAIGAITRLNPKPGGPFAVVNRAETYVVPDFFAYNNGGKIEITLNARNAPELRVSEGYREMMKAYDRSDKKNKDQKEAVTFIKQKLDAAKWFIDAIRQRQQTLMHTMQAIVEFQREFFLTGDETNLRPMILKDIAKITQLDVSTVSRVANSKHVQTEFGTFRLKYFFSEGLQLESGEEVSTREVKSILAGLIAAEEKRRPLSDDKLTDMLAEKGYHIARRTVAKYREQLGIPVARLRRGL